jgi:hypothetical protein
MANPLFIAATYAKPGRKQDLLDCYVNEHLPDMGLVPGMGHISLYTVAPIKLPEGVPAPDAFIIHELEVDPGEILRIVTERSRSGEIRHTDALDGTRSIVFIANAVE